MKEDHSRQRLGRGLAALLGQSESENASVQLARAQRRVPLEHLRPNPFNPRKSFGESELEDLAASIRKRGVLQPILVRAVVGKPDVFEIIAGERRWRAAQRAGVFDIPANVIEASNQQTLEIAIVENVQRSDLNAIEEAQGYQKLCIDFGYTHTDLAREIGKSRSHVANTLRLLNLPGEARQMLLDGSISAGHARALLALENPELIAQMVVQKNLTVRDVEELGKSSRSAKTNGENANQTKIGYNKTVNSDITSISDELSDKLGLLVLIKKSGNLGRLTIRFSDDEQLSRIHSLLMK